MAGLEPENTNMFLLELIKLCVKPGSIDVAEAVKRVLNGEAPGQRPPPKISKAEAKASSSSGVKSAAKGGGTEASEAKSGEMSNSDGGKLDFKNSSGGDDDTTLAERGKSRGGTRSGKPPMATAETGLHGFGSANATNLDRFIEQCDGLETTTQTLLGEIIQKPKLTEKLLSKPPFRFLHDIIMEIIRVTGFAADLFTTVEMDSAQISDKEQKIIFLEKIIRLVGVQLNTIVQAKPAKIVAGLDPQNTNNFLQLMAVACKHAPDSKTATCTVLQQLGQPIPSNLMGNDSRGTSSMMSPEPSRAQPKADNASKFDSKADENKPSVSNSMAAADDDDGDEKRSARPSTARRRPPKVKDGAKELSGKDAPPVQKKISGLIIDGQNGDDDDDDNDIVDETRLADDLKAESKAISNQSADPQSKLVKDILSRQVEQEAASRSSVVAEPAADDSEAKELGGEGSKGGIRLGRLKKTGLDAKKAGGGPVTASGSAVATLAESDLERMRGSIQQLVQHTGPLGTCMDYIQEDISLMTAELHKWEEECRKHESELDGERRKTREVLHSLAVEKAEVDLVITEQIAKISSLKANIAKNDDSIQQILKLIVTA